MDRENGKFLTVDPAYNPTTFTESKPKEEFRKSKKKKEEDKSEDADWFVSKIQHIDLHRLQETDKDAYRRTVMDTLALSEEDLITPHVSQTFALNDVNEAVKFITQKKCTGKVLIDIKQKKDSKDH